MKPFWQGRVELSSGAGELAGDREVRVVIRSPCTDKKENKIVLIYKVIQMGWVAKSYMKKGFPIYEEIRKYLTIYEEAFSHI